MLPVIAEPGSVSTMWPFTRLLRGVRRFFVRKQLPPPPDWYVGDVAEAIGNQPWIGGPERAPVRGAQAMVLHVRPGESSTGELGWSLVLLGYAGAWDARGFRKVTPPQADESAAIRRTAPAPTHIQP